MAGRRPRKRFENVAFFSCVVRPQFPFIILHTQDQTSYLRLLMRCLALRSVDLAERRPRKQIDAPSSPAHSVELVAFADILNLCANDPSRMSEERETAVAETIKQALWLMGSR
jgi:hypothetical protein